MEALLQSFWAQTLSVSLRNSLVGFGGSFVATGVIDASQANIVIGGVMAGRRGLVCRRQADRPLHAEEIRHLSLT